MAHEKRIASGTIPATINFYYPTESVFSESSLRSMYYVFNKSNEDPDSVDKFSFTEDERVIHLRLLRDASHDVFNSLIKYTKSIPNAIFFNIQYEGLKTVDDINNMTSYVTGLVFKMTDGGTISPGGVTVVADDLVYYSGSEWVKDNAQVQLTSGVKIVDNAAYNENYIVSIDENLQKAIQFRILRDWFLMKSLDEDAVKCGSSFLEAQRLFISNAFQLKKVLLG